MTQPERGQSWGPRVVYASQSCLSGDSVLVILPFAYTPGKSCQPGYVTCVPFPLPLCLLNVCARASGQKKSEIQHLPFAYEDGTLISRMKNGHLKGQWEWWSIQQAPGVAKTGQHGCSPAGVCADLPGGPPALGLPP